MPSVPKNLSRLALLAAAVLTATSVAVLVPALQSYPEARASWQRESRNVGDTTYSATRSDELYARAERELTRLRLGARASFVALLLWLALLGGAPLATGGAEVGPGRRALATLVDALWAFGAFGFAVWAGEHERDSTLLATAAAPGLLWLWLPYARLLGARHTLGMALVGARPSELRLPLRIRGFLLGPVSIVSVPLLVSPWRAWVGAHLPKWAWHLSNASTENANRH